MKLDLASSSDNQSRNKHPLKTVHDLFHALKPISSVVTCPFHYDLLLFCLSKHDNLYPSAETGECISSVSSDVRILAEVIGRKPLNDPF